ncbi:hypothetical protein BGZ65_007298 [Modicella reniformis]|uniref:Uncharacterized protein n=1 Tax=Modicella reniformis TaxID=1440133 RepID=A0A9P6JGZ5_9FUNG|nr:hypothetical protein BGZ65_007298 [Modicella reniformis]
MTTVIGDATFGDEYSEDEDDEYDGGESGDDDNDDDDEGTGGSRRQQPERGPVIHVQDYRQSMYKDHPPRDLASNGSPASGSNVSESMKHVQSIDGEHPQSSGSGAESTPTLREEIHGLPDDAPPSDHGRYHNRTGISVYTTLNRSSLIRADAEARRNSALVSTRPVTTMIPTSFYLPLECRQRIHTQVQQEGRTDGPHIFGPAKAFVVDVVLRDHYYPLFLQYVEQKNLGLLHRNHVNNRTKQRGIIALGLVLWMIVVAIQVTLVMMDWGAEDKHLFRFRRTIEPSVRARHRTRALKMLFLSLVYATLVAVIFSGLPQRQQ